MVYLPIWKIWVRQLGWLFPTERGKKKSKPPTSFYIFPYMSISFHIIISISFHILTPWPTSHLHFFPRHLFDLRSFGADHCGSRTARHLGDETFFMCRMELLYMETWIPSIYPIHVSIYTSTMDSMGFVDECCISIWMFKRSYRSITDSVCWWMLHTMWCPRSIAKLV